MAEVVAVALVVVDVAAGERRLIEVPDEHLLLERQRGEAVGIELHDGGIVHPLEQVGRSAGGASDGAGGFGAVGFRSCICWMGDARRLATSSGKGTRSPCLGICTFQANSALDARLQDVLGRRLAVDEVGHRGGAGNVRSQRTISLASACADIPFSFSILAMHGNELPVNLDLLGTFYQLPATGAGRLESNEEHGVPGIGQPLGQVVQDPPAGGHAAGGDDDGRAGASTTALDSSAVATGVKRAVQNAHTSPRRTAMSSSSSPACRW